MKNSKQALLLFTNNFGMTLESNSPTESNYQKKQNERKLNYKILTIASMQ